MPLWYYCISRLLAGMGYLRDILRAALRHTCTAAEHTSGAANRLLSNSHCPSRGPTSTRCELRGPPKFYHYTLVVGSLYSVEWTTGMPLDLKFNHKLPIRMWDMMVSAECPQPTHADIKMCNWRCMVHCCHQKEA